jgi:hypothetical protein
LPDDEKTIKPTSLGGIAGGIKYRVHNIIFKFPLNMFNLYADYEAAAKVAGHELKGLLACLSSGVPNIGFPLISLLDYRGYRLGMRTRIRSLSLSLSTVAMTALPVTASTLVFGSMDAGRNFVNKNKQAKVVIDNMCSSLNLAKHRGTRTCVLRVCVCVLEKITIASWEKVFHSSADGS